METGPSRIRHRRSPGPPPFRELRATRPLRFRPLAARRHASGSLDDAFKMRCHAALPFGLSPNEVASEKTKQLRSDFLRAAFNSPFRPYVLATTSIGQEGLDFHVYCNHVVHRDLPSNPVELEQRVGRVNRYAGLAVRRILAGRITALRPNESPWTALGRALQESVGGLS